MDKQMARGRNSYQMKYKKRKRSRGSAALLRISIVFFVLLYAYAFVRATGIKTTSIRTSGIGTGKEENIRIIRCETETGVSEVPLEDFLVLALSANIDMEYEMETLKAQAVLLRGNCIRKAQGNLPVDSKQLDFPYYSQEELRMLWGNKYELYYKKAWEAVHQTKGIYAKSGDDILNGNFHAMSGGRTRSGAEVMGEESFSYLQSVPCNKNLESEYFLETKQFEKDETTTLEILQRDSAGYVTKVSWNGTTYSGEQLRDALGLASANFEIENGETCRITTKGIGHGFGFDQYYANYMAQELGEDYMELISYFYKDISFLRTI